MIATSTAEDTAPKPDATAHRSQYRPDIDGLRAVAVLAVVGFHAFPKLVQSGFIGVDIFFGISGYLISAIIIDGLQRQRFSFIAFYGRRIRRIFPALIIVLAASYGLGWVILFPKEFSELGRHIVSGAGFLSNFTLFQERGYFSRAADTKPLLHLWSLGIEEQFYIFWPALLWLCFRLRLDRLGAIAAVFAISLALGVLDVHDHPIASFYLPPTRIWELAAGALLAAARQRFPAITASPGQRDLGSALGGLLILAGLVLTPTDDFPGWWPLLPLTGVVLLIAVGPQALINRRILAHPALVWVGLISYPLYLWHWPLLSFARILTGEPPAPVAIRIGAVALAVILAWLTTTLVERRLRFGGHGRLKVAALVTSMICLGLVGYGTTDSGGLAFRSVVQINNKTDSGVDGGSGGMLARGCGIADPKEAKLFSRCLQDYREVPTYALLGDSKADSLFPALVRTSAAQGRWLFIGGANSEGGQVPILSDSPIYPPLYAKLAAISVKAVAENQAVKSAVLVMAARSLLQLKRDATIEDLPDSENYGAALQGLEKTVETLLDAGKRVTIVIDNPTLPAPEDCMERQSSANWLNWLLRVRKGPDPRCYPTVAWHLAVQARYRDMLAQIVAMGHGRVTLFDTMEYLCDLKPGICPPQRNGHRLYSYSDHISDYAAGSIAQGLNDFLAQNQAESPAPANVAAP
jgi:peptidoglycan/LPS O-acetylase OafA/YrhL